MTMCLWISAVYHVLMLRLNFPRTNTLTLIFFISEADVGTAIDKLNNGKSADEYRLSYEHFKVAKSIIVPVLTRLFNEILTTKDIPDSFKSCIITPVLKKGKDPKIVGNYKSITVSSTSW